MDGVTLADLQGKFDVLAPVLKARMSPTVYLATLTPGNAKSAAVNTVRQAYNSWLTALPGGARGLFDFSGAISTDDTTISSGFNSDRLHVNTAGQAAFSAVVESKPVSPDVLTPGRVHALRALIP